jgi:hypothetical protein
MAKAFNRLAPGVDWREMSKGDMVQTYMRGEHGLGTTTIADVHEALVAILNREYGFALLMTN